MHACMPSVPLYKYHDVWLSYALYNMHPLKVTTIYTVYG